MEKNINIESSEREKEKLTIIDPSEFDKEEYLEYLKALREECINDEGESQISYPVAEIYLGNRKFLVTAEDNSGCYEGPSYVVAYKDDDKVKIYGCALVDGNFSFFDEDHLYLFDGDKVERYRHEDEMNEIISTTENPAEPDKICFNYSQISVPTGKGVILSYPRPDHCTNENFVYYLHNKIPEYVQFVYTKPFMHVKSYWCIDDIYQKFKVTAARDAKRCMFASAYTQAGMEAMINSKGFAHTIPKEMIDMYAGNDIHTNCLKRTMQMYHDATSY